MRYFKLLLVLLLISVLLLGCGKDTPEDITLYSGLSIVVPAAADNTTAQAAAGLQAYFSNKTNLPMPAITTDDPGENAIVLKVDSSLAAGAYSFVPKNGSLYVTAGNAHTLMYATKLLRQALLDAPGSTLLTVALCESLSGEVPADNIPFTVITQNILSKEADGGNSITDRVPRLQALVTEYQPDILALQENSPEWQGYYQGFLMEHYFAVNQETVTILLRKDRYEVVEQGFFYLSPTPDVRSQFEGDSGPRRCTWAVVTDKLTGRTFLVYSTHPDWNNDTQRALQVGVLLEQLGPYFEKYPTIGCGDFNTERNSPVYATITAQFLDSAETATRKLSTIDHTCHSFGSTQSYIDYIFHSEALQPESHYIISEMYGGYVSDHYGVCVQFRFATE